MSVGIAVEFCVHVTHAFSVGTLGLLMDYCKLSLFRPYYIMFFFQVWKYSSKKGMNHKINCVACYSISHIWLKLFSIFLHKPLKRKQYQISYLIWLQYLWKAKWKCYARKCTNRTFNLWKFECFCSLWKLNLFWKSWLVRWDADSSSSKYWDILFSWLYCFC